MTTASYNPDDPLFLASRGLDGDLSDDERRRLERAKSASPELRAEADQLAAAETLVRQWGRAQPEVDWNSFGETVHARLLTEAESAAVDRVDALVMRWATSTPDIDAEAFTQNVLLRLGANEKSTWLRPVLRIGLPLAAAAAIVLAVMNDLWRPDAPGSTGSAVVVVDVGRSRSVEARGVAEAERAVVSVSFSRERTVEANEHASISFISISSAPVVRIVEEYYPL